jgi:hypothetical protein
MTKSDTYRHTLSNLPDWEPYLLKQSGLPGPRGNLELAAVVADLGDRALFEHFLTFTPELAPTNDPHEFLAFCGVVGMGHLLAEGDTTLLTRLRPYACDPRWRLREAVAMALQRWGKKDMSALLAAMLEWSSGNWLEMRAAAAALAEPVLLNVEAHALAALHILDSITASMENSPQARSPEYRILHQGMSYCWSVVVVAVPTEGKRLMEKWLSCPDPIIRRIMHANLKKNRLARLDPVWVRKWSESG